MRDGRVGATRPSELPAADPIRIGSIMVGSGLGAKRGILFKNAVAVEQAARLDTVVFDKTGTLTRGEPEVVAVATTDGVDTDHVLALVAAAEGDSEHPLAQAIVAKARERRLNVERTDDFEAVPGHGAIAVVEGRRLARPRSRRPRSASRSAPAPTSRWRRPMSC
jgi:P-type Cu2+ transporter